MTTVYINFNGSPPAPFDDNNLGETERVITSGAVVADLLDSTTTATGIAFEVVTAAGNKTGGSTVATAGTARWSSDLVFDGAWISANGGTSTYEYTGLTEGDTYSLWLAGHNLSGRSTDFTVNATTTRYLNSNDAAAPAEPIEFTGTVPANGKVTFSFTAASVGGAFYGYLSAAELIITPAAATYGIDTPDTLTQGVETTVTGNGLAATTAVDIRLTDDSQIITQSFTEAAGVLTLTPDVNFDVVAGVPEASLPFVPDISAAGTTPYSILLRTTNGTDVATRAVSLYAPAGYTTVQTMASIANTTSENSFFYALDITVTDDMQLTVGTAGGILSVDDKGLWSVSKADMTAAGGSITVPVSYYDKGTMQRSGGYEVTITEPAAPEMGADTSVDVNEGVTAVGTYAATAGAAPIVYTLTGTDAADFNINSATGAVTFKVAPGANGTSGYSIGVTATNATGEATQNITINIISVSPVVYGSSTYTVAENGTFSAEYTVINMAGVAATLAGDDAARFSWTKTGADKYVLGWAGQDYEAPADLNTDQVYHAQIVADDGINPAVTFDVAVTVTDVKEVVIVPPTDATLYFTYGDAGLPHSDPALVSLLNSAVNATSNNLPSFDDPIPAGDIVFLFDADDANQASTNVTVAEMAAPSDITPDRIHLGAPVTNAATSSVHKTLPVIITGTDAGANLTISVTDAEYRIDGGAWTSASGFIQSGQALELRVTASATVFTPVLGLVNVSGVIGSFYVVTGANIGGPIGVEFFVREASSESLIKNTTIDIKVLTSQFGGALLYEFDDLPIGANGFLSIPLTGGEEGRQVFISGVLASGKYITGATEIIQLAA